MFKLVVFTSILLIFLSTAATSQESRRESDMPIEFLEIDFFGEPAEDIERRNGIEIRVVGVGLVRLRKRDDYWCSSRLSGHVRLRDCRIEVISDNYWVDQIRGSVDIREGGTIGRFQLYLYKIWRVKVESHPENARVDIRIRAKSFRSAHQQSQFSELTPFQFPSPEFPPLDQKSRLIMQIYDSEEENYEFTLRYEMLVNEKDKKETHDRGKIAEEISKKKAHRSNSFWRSIKRKKAKHKEFVFELITP